MVTSVITAASSADQMHHQAASPSAHECGRRDPAAAHPVRRGPGKRRARAARPSSGGQRKNKQPRRGMGVAKLERLSMLDRWKKMTEIGSQGNPNRMLSDPIPNLGGYGAPISVGLNPGFPYGQVDPLGSGAGCCTEHSYACHKKKKINVGEYGFLGLNNLGEYQNVMSPENHHQGLNVGMKMAMGTGFGNSGKQDNGGIVGGCSSTSSAVKVMMEYEFFPVCRLSDNESPLPETSSNYVDLSLRL